MSTNPDSPVPAPEIIAPQQKTKSSTRGILEDFIVSGFGLATSAAVAYGSYYGAKNFDFAPYTWMANGIIPIGAILCGLVAAIGYWVGARWFHHRPTRLLLCNIVLVSLTTYFSIQHIEYSHMTVKGVPVQDVMSFPDYLTATIEHMTYRRSGSNEEGVELGKWGWGVAALQVVGFTLGGFLVYGMLTAVPYCDRCSKYFSKQWSRVAKFKEAFAATAGFDSVANLMSHEQLQPAIDLHGTLGEHKRFSVKGLVTLLLQKCPDCENRQLKLIEQQRRGNKVVHVRQLMIPTEQPLHKAGAPA